MNKQELVLKVKKSLGELEKESERNDGFNEYSQFVEELFIELLPCFQAATLEYIYGKSEKNKRLK